MEMSDNTKNKREELNTILTKILDEGDVGKRGWWWFKSVVADKIRHGCVAETVVLIIHLNLHQYPCPLLIQTFFRHLRALLFHH